MLSNEIPGLGDAQTPPPHISGAEVAIKMWQVVSSRGPVVTVPDLIRFWIGWFAAIAALATVFFLFATQAHEPASSSKPAALVLLVGWTVLPPLFFWFDYFVLWQLEHQKKNPQYLPLDEFKHGQEVSRNLWLALVALLAGIYFH